MSQELGQGFHRISREERIKRLRAACQLTDEEAGLLLGREAIPPSLAEHFVENVLGFFPVPFGVATHFVIDGQPRLIPMVVEETSIIAAASATAKWIRTSGGEISTEAVGRHIIGQIQIPSITNVARFRDAFGQHREELVALANRCVPSLTARGGGISDVSVRVVPRKDDSGEMAVLHLLCDPCDAMGANLINQVCEALKPEVERLTHEKVGLCILSNLVDTKKVRAQVVLRDLDPQVAQGIAEASLFAESDPYRACTHNKGVLNGIDPILIATGNDWRAVEAGIHAYASRSGTYSPITRWTAEGSSLTGVFEAPLAVGVVGGVTRTHPMARICLKIMGVSKGEELARVCAGVGLVQNLGALRALSTVGIVRGHMQLHAANLAIAAGAHGPEIGEVRDQLAQVLQEQKRITLTHAVEILENLRSAAHQPV